MLGILAAACSLFSCNKLLEDPTPTAAPAAVDSASLPALLTAAAWHQTGLLVSTTGPDQQPTSADLAGHVSPRLLDQAARFQPAGAYTVVKGGALPQPKTGTWTLTPAHDSLILELPGQTRRLAVAELTANVLRLSFTEAAPTGVVSTYTSVYAH